MKRLFRKFPLHRQVLSLISAYLSVTHEGADKGQVKTAFPDFWKQKFWYQVDSVTLFIDRIQTAHVDKTRVHKSS